MTKTAISRHWKDLNTQLMKAGEAECKRLLAEEKKKGNRRETFLLRIHSRLNRLRAMRERKELIAIAEQ